MWWPTKLLLGALIACLLVAAWCACSGRHEEFVIENTRPVRGPNNEVYWVHESYKDPQAAAATLSELNKRAIRLMRHLRVKYSPDDVPYARKQAVELLLRRYNPDALAENSPINKEHDTSYTLDKGALIAMCLRGKDSESSYKIENIDVLTFVLLHEMSHVATNTAPDEDAHSPPFWATFKFILQEAQECGLDMYGAVSRERPRKYCGMTVSYNPLRDPGRESI